MADLLPRIVVTAAVICREDQYFVTRRHRGVHLEGYWEFPGGKCESDESLEDCLVREIREELGTGLKVRGKLLVCSHAYPMRVVELHFFDCEMQGDPRPMLGQEMKWIRRADLKLLDFPPADDELVGMLMRQG